MSKKYKHHRKISSKHTKKSKNKEINKPADIQTHDVTSENEDFHEFIHSVFTQSQIERQLQMDYELFVALRLMEQEKERAPYSDIEFNLHFMHKFRQRMQLKAETSEDGGDKKIECSLEALEDLIDSIHLIEFMQENEFLFKLFLVNDLMDDLLLVDWIL